MLETQNTAPTATQNDDARVVIDQLLSANNAVTIASTGGPYSPWVLGAYFAHEGLSLYLTLETHGKTMANVHANPYVALTVSQNDAMKDFLQARGKVTLLTATEDDAVRTRLVAKMPWYATYTPVTYCRIDLSEVFVSSFARSWFPAKVVKNELTA